MTGHTGSGKDIILVYVIRLNYTGLVIAGQYKAGQGIGGHDRSESFRTWEEIPQKSRQYRRQLDSTGKDRPRLIGLDRTARDPQGTTIQDAVIKSRARQVMKGKDST